MFFSFSLVLQRESPAHSHRKPPAPPTASVIPPVRIFRSLLFARTRGGTALRTCAKAQQQDGDTEAHRDDGGFPNAFPCFWNGRWDLRQV